MAEGIRGSDDASFECTACSDNGNKIAADEYCQVCKQFLCSTCILYHKRFKATKNHLLIDATSVFGLGRSAGANISSESNVPKCRYHPQRDIEMYCTTHDTVYCSLCIAKNHRQCEEVKDIHDMAIDNSQTDVSQLISDYNTLNRELHQIMNQKVDNTQHCNKEQSDILELIGEIRREYDKHLDDIEAGLIATVKVQHDNVLRDLQSEIAAIDQQIKLGDHSISQLKQHTLTDSQMFVLNKLVEQHIKSMKSFLENGIVRKPVSLAFEPNHHLRDEIMSAECLGVVTKIDVESFQGYKYTVTSNQTVNVKVDADKRICLINDACQLSNGTILLLDNWNKHIKRLNDKLEVTEVFKLKSEPYGICVVNSFMVAVRLLNKTVQFISVDATFTAGTAIKIKNQSKQSGLACCKSRLWVPGINGINVFSLAGKLEMEIREDKNGQALFCEYSACHVAVNMGETRVYAATGSDQVFVFNDDGEYLDKLINDILRGTECVCVTSQDDVIVSGMESKNVVMFNAAGQCMGAIIQSVLLPHDLFCLCYDTKHKRVILGLHIGSDIQVFHLE